MLEMQDTRTLAAAINSARPDTDETDMKVVDAIYRLLATGRPVADAEIASAAALSLAKTTKRIGQWPGVFRNEQDEIIGFWGLSIVEMPPHQINVNGQALWAWCAWDTLFLPSRLNATVQVSSVCPVTKQELALRVSPDAIETAEPKEIVVSFLEPDEAFDANVITSFCHFVHFFATPEAGRKWISEHPGTFLVTLKEAFELGKLTLGK